MLDSAGVVDAVRDLTDGRGADMVMDFVGSDQTHADALGMLARRGTYSMVGFGGTLSVPSAAMVGGEQTAVANLVGSWIDLWEVMQLHGRGQVDSQDRDAPAGRRERRTGNAARGRSHRSRRPRTQLG